MTAVTSEQDLVFTPSGSRLHVRACPHLGDTAVLVAGPAELAAREVCSWCRAELDGVGRTYFTGRLQAAMQAFGLPVEAQPAVRRFVVSTDHDAIWIPYSASYIALGLRGPVVAWVAKGYIQPVDGPRILNEPIVPRLLPRRDVPDVCPQHFVTRSLTGVCASCED